MLEPRITVIIPTRERCDVLRESLRTVTNQDYGNLQIIVSDNFSQDRTRDVVADVADRRVKYLNTGQRLSMSRNWEFALSHVAEGWVTIIGDDDGLLPGTLQRVAAIAAEGGVQAIRSSVCTYKWPSLTGTGSGLLSVPLKSGHEIRSSRKWLDRVLNGRAGYTELPMLYNGGYVDVAVLRRIQNATGSIYRSCIPDIYAAISIASTIDRYLFENEPLAINGASRHSTGTSTFAIGGSSSGSPAALFASEANIPLHADIPLCADGSYPPSAQALIYESYLQSMCLREPVREQMHELQLEIILAAESGRKDALQAWGKSFASQHSLDFDSIATRARRRERLLSLTSIYRRAAVALDTQYAGSEEMPIKDVFQASLAACAIRKSRPPRMTRVPRLLGRAFQELRQYAG